MSVIRTNAAFENSFVSVLDKHAPKKKKNYERIENPTLIRTFGSK